jgi:general secretion pathway protein D
MVKVLMNLPGEKQRPGGKGQGRLGRAGAPPAISKDVKIVADAETNSLIITGPREEYEAVEGGDQEARYSPAHGLSGGPDHGGFR